MNILITLRYRIAFGVALAMVAMWVPRASAAQRARAHVSSRDDSRGAVDTTFAFDHKGTVTVVAMTGDIVVRGHADGNLRVRTSGDDPDVRLDASSSRLTIETTGRRGGDTKFELEVPIGVRVIARTRSGSVTIRGTRGAVEIHAQSGDITVDDVDGGLDVNTFSGDVIASHVAGDFTANTINGDIKVTDLRGNADAQTISGDVEIIDAACTSVRATTTSGSITYDGSIDPAGHYQMKSQSGDLTLHIPRDASAQLSVSTWSGEIDSGEFPMVLKPGQHGIGIASAKKFTFDIGGGAARISAETFSGDVTLSANGHGASTRRP